MFYSRKRWFSAYNVPFVPAALARGVVRRVASYLALVAAALVLLGTGEVVAQNYAQMTVRLKPGEAKLAQGEAIKILRNATSLTNDQKKTLANFFNGYYFPQMTSTDAESLSELSESRKKFFQNFLNPAKSQAVRDDMVRLTIATMGKIAMGNYHPAARYNAILLIGSLDQTPATRNQPPTPLPAATKALIAVLDRDEIAGVRVPISAKVGALVGLERHARFGIDEQYADQVAKSSLTVIGQAEPPVDVSRGVHHWMKCIAARVLVNQFAAAPTAELQGALTSMISDQEMSLDDRCCAAQLLQRIQYADAADLNVDETTLALGQLANAVLSKEAKDAKKYQDDRLGETGFSSRQMGGRFGGYSGMDGEEGGFGGFGGYGGRDEGGFGGYGGYGGMDGEEGGFGGYGGFGLQLGNTQQQGPKLAKRRMLARLKSVVVAADSVAEASEEAKTKLSELSGPVKTLLADAVKKDAIDVSIATAVIALADEVSSVVAAWQPEAAEPGEPTEEAAAEAFGE